MKHDDFFCWEALDPADPALEQARGLYETTLSAEERIPWEWIEGAVAGRRAWRPGEWSAHLLLAAERARQGPPGPVVGFAYGVHLPGYGGYACYLGVELRRRGRGAGTRLLQLLTRVLQVDAECEGGPLPFVVLESHAPEADAPPTEREVWQARLRLFERVGARWVSGLTLHAPSFGRRGQSVPLQLFVIPVGWPPERFDAAALREVAAGLLEGVYRRRPGDRLFEKTLPADCTPSLRPVAELAAATLSPQPA